MSPNNTKEHTYMLLINNNIFYQKFKVFMKNFCFSLAERGIFMGFKKKPVHLSEEKNRQIQKVINTLRLGGRSETTIKMYVSSISRFLKAFENEDISTFDEDKIMEYIKCNFIDKHKCVETYNVNICAIKYFYIVNFRKEFNDTLLPRAKRTKKLPTTLDKKTFIKIFNEEKNMKHKCWLLLAYCSGLREEEIAKVRIKDINSSEHELKVLGKGKKERITILPDITIKYMRIYYIQQYYPKYHKRINKSGYLFEGIKGAVHIHKSTISNYFIGIKKKHKLDDKICFHSLRHSFATNFIKAGGDPFVLKTMMGHTALSTTDIYIHLGRDFNNLKGVNYNGI